MTPRLSRKRRMPIKTLGMTEVQIKLGKDAVATVKVWVVKKE
jgi:ribosomal protein L9